MGSRRIILVILLAGLLSALPSCSRQAYPDGARDSARERKERAAAYSQVLGFRVTHRDDLRFYGEIVSWMGTPYRHGGNSRGGIDCSGFVYAVYRNVYNKPIDRTVETMQERSTVRIDKRRVETGDLLFFVMRGGKKATHVGIYLKSGYFVHASSSRGVTIDNVSDGYYKTAWRRAGRVK